MTLVHKLAPDGFNLIPVSDANPLPVTGGGGSGGGSVEVTNFPASQAVTGPLTNAQYTAVAGTAAATAWAGTGSGTEISILKAIYAQNVTITGLLNDIKTNTTPSG